MRVLVTGAKGQLGTDLLAELAKRNIDAIGVDVDDMDITDMAACESVFTRLHSEKPIDAVMHLAAWTAVDAAEDHEEKVRLVNAIGTKHVAQMAARIGAKMMYISTDYVFDGEGDRPWQPDDKRDPLNIYAKTKYEGELYVEEASDKYFIVRISWVFGRNGKNFISTMLGLGRQHGEVRVVDDQIGSPTYTPDLSVLLADMIQSEKYGRYHATNEGYCSWYEFACEIFRAAGMSDVKVHPCSSDEFPTKAKRPHNSRMDKSKLVANGFNLLPTWQDATRRYLIEMGEIS